MSEVLIIHAKDLRIGDIIRPMSPRRNELHRVVAHDPAAKTFEVEPLRSGVDVMDKKQKWGGGRHWVVRVRRAVAA
jgi:hypothetical protein